MKQPGKQGVPSPPSHPDVHALFLNLNQPPSVCVCDSYQGDSNLDTSTSDESYKPNISFSPHPLSTPLNLLNIPGSKWK